MNNKILKTALLFIAFVSILFSCTEEEKETKVGTVNFTSADLIEVEGATIPLLLNIGVDSFSHTGGTIHVNVTGGNYGSDYTLSSGSSSFDLTVKPGSMVASFSVSPINDLIIESDVNLVFTITSVTGGLVIGNKTILNLKLLNDDNPTIGTVNFQQATYNVNENDLTPLTINLPFNQPSTLGGTISIAATGNASLITDYAVVGQTTQNFTINVPAGATAASFNFQSIDDAIGETSESVTFTITGVTGGLQSQSPLSTTVNIVDNDVSYIPINYVETFEGNTGTNYLTTTLGYSVLPVTQASNITTLMNANTAAAAYADVTAVTGTSNNGINLFHNAGSPANTALLGDLDQVLISPSMNGTGNVTYSIDYNHSFTAQNNGVVTFYWSETYTGGAFIPAQWTQIGTDTGADLITAGYTATTYRRRLFALNPTSPFRIAVRVTQNINATNYRTRWRFDNIKLTN